MRFFQFLLGWWGRPWSPTTGLHIMHVAEHRTMFIDADQRGVRVARELRTMLVEG